MISVGWQVFLLLSFGFLCGFIVGCFLVGYSVAVVEREKERSGSDKH